MSRIRMGSGVVGVEGLHIGYVGGLLALLGSYLVSLLILYLPAVLISTMRLVAMKKSPKLIYQF